MTEERTMKKPKSILVFEILATVFLIPALYGTYALLITYIDYASGVELAGLGLALVLAIYLITFLPCNLVCLLFGILGSVKSSKYHKRTENSKGKVADRIWLTVLLTLASLSLAFFVYLFIALQLQ